MSLTKLEQKYIRDRRAGRILNPVPGHRVTLKWDVKGSLWLAGHHTGEDHKCDVGTPLAAVSWGHVVGAGWGGAPHDLGPLYGNVVMIEMANGKYEYFYAHMSRFNVHVGQAVIPGQIIGWSGDTGHTTGPHCHFEVRPVGGSYDSDVAPIHAKKGLR